MMSLTICKSFELLRCVSSRTICTLNSSIIKTNVQITTIQNINPSIQQPLTRRICNWCRIHHRKSWNNSTSSLILSGKTLLTRSKNTSLDLFVPLHVYGVNLQQRCGFVTAPDKVKKVPVAKLTTPKRGKKKLFDDVDDSHVHKKVFAYAVGAELDLKALKSAIMKENLYSIVKLPIDVTDAFMVTANYQVNGQSREALFFSDGGVACWHMPETERKNIWQSARACAVNPHDVDHISEENESLSVMYDSTVSKLVGGTVHLKGVGSGEEMDANTELKLHKYTISNALSQSVNLAISEANLQTFIDQLEPETMKLRQGVKSEMSKKQINMRLGKVFLLRHEINLESGFLDIPDIYWEREELEGLYREMIAYLSMPKRVTVLNERLNYCSEILQLFSSQLNDQHHVRLEWIIIILILIEVCFECVHYAEKYGYININNNVTQGYDQGIYTTDQQVYTRSLDNSTQQGSNNSQNHGSK